jgi:hypothetical protein
MDWGGTTCSEPCKKMSVNENYTFYILDSRTLLCAENTTGAMDWGGTTCSEPCIKMSVIENYTFYILDSRTLLCT